MSAFFDIGVSGNTKSFRQVQRQFQDFARDFNKSLSTLNKETFQSMNRLQSTIRNAVYGFSDTLRNLDEKVYKNLESSAFRSLTGFSKITKEIQTMQSHINKSRRDLDEMAKRSGKDITLVVKKKELTQRLESTDSNVRNAAQQEVDTGTAKVAMGELLKMIQQSKNKKNVSENNMADIGNIAVDLRKNTNLFNTLSKREQDIVTKLQSQASKSTGKDEDRDQERADFAKLIKSAGLVSKKELPGLVESNEEEQQAVAINTGLFARTTGGPGQKKIVTETSMDDEDKELLQRSENIDNDEEKKARADKQAESMLIKSIYPRLGRV
jgi:hypothetical protein